MKILAIRLKNLASLAGPFELDFTAEPLASAGLFAITGPTGAGKSTLLDALCLALFGAVPRLSKTGRDAKVPDADGEIGSGDPRTLLRRGTGEGYAEVDFRGIDGRRYRARWEANRARDKANGKLQASRQSLRDLDNDQLLASQKGDYKAQLEACLGLNFEQFTRAVMLAQSEFSAFLKADDNERSELLEKLTDTALYTRLGLRAFNKSKEAREAHKLLQDQAGGISPLEPEARAALDQGFADAQQQLKAEQEQLKQLERQSLWLKEMQQWQEQVRSAHEQLHQAQQQWEEQSQQRQDLKLLEQLAPQRHQFSRQEQLQAQLTPLAEGLERHRQQQSELQARQQQLEQSQQTAQAALVQAQSQQSAAAPLLRQAFDEQKHLADLSKTLGDNIKLVQAAEHSCQQGQTNLQDLLARQSQVADRLEQITGQLQHSAALAPLAQAWNAYRPQLQQLVLLGNRLTKGRGELPALEQRAALAEQELNEQRGALEILYREAGAEPDAVSEQIQTLGNLLHASRQQQRSVEDLERLWNAQQRLDVRQQELQDKQLKAQEQHDQLTQQGLQTRKALDVAEQTLTVTRELLARQRLARSASVEELRGQLQDDQPCPVCGSQEHPYHQPEALLQSLTQHDESEEEAARKTVDELKEKLAQLREKVGGLKAQLKEFAQQQEQLATEQQAETPQQAAHPLFPQLQDQAASQRDAWLTQRLSQLQHSINQDEQRKTALLTLQKDATRLQQQLKTATEASQQAAHLLADQQRHLQSDSQRFAQELAGFASLIPADSLQALQLNATDAFMQLDQQVSQRLAQLEQQRDEQQEQQARQETIGKEQLQQQNRVQQLNDLQQQHKALFEQQQISQQKLQQWLGEQPSAEHWQQQLEQALEHSRNAANTASQALQQTREQWLELGAKVDSQQQQHQALEQESRELGAALSQWRSQHPELDDSLLQQLLARDEEQLKALRQQLQHSEKAIEQAKVLLQEREARLATHQAQHSDPLDTEQLDSALTLLREQLTASEQRCADLRAEIAQDQQRINATQSLQQQMAAALSEYRRWARLNDLIGSSTGDKFRKIAQAYNLDLLLHHANAQLRQLVKRYRLKRGGSLLGLLVLDTEMGDELRSVHSLSGGETFLVSLALALGLASMASSTLKIESLFIDEGFGSLDPESLQLAMDALDGLQAQGRKVAVISHVQEMHERIPVQIQVRRQGNGLSSLEVI